MTDTQRQQYFARIGYTPKEGESEVEILQNIHRGHAFHIPFENIDVYHKKTLSLTEDDLFDKMVTRRRGGYCFEMNGLMYFALTKLGFRVHSVLARIGGKERGLGSLLHRMNIVFLSDGSKWIADVGFGGEGLIEAVPMTGEPFETFGKTYRVVENGAGGMKYSVQVLIDGEYIDQFAFHESPNTQQDFEVCSFYTNCYPESVFRKFPMCTLPTPTGRISISNDRLRITENGEITDRFFTPEELPTILREYFGIVAE